MKSLRSQIQASLIGSIVIIAVVAMILLWINQLNSLSNQKIIRTMTTEYSIIALSESLVQQYNTVTKNPGNQTYALDYQKTHNRLTETMAQLYQSVTRPESRTLLVGIDHTVKEIITHCDEGLAEMKQGNYAALSDHYAQANKINVFINENTKTLLGKELEYLYTTQQNALRTYYVILAISLSLFLLITAGMIATSRTFASQLITPLSQLSVFAKDVAGGNLEAVRTTKLKITQDEIGSLTQSVYTMVDKLVSMLNSEQQAREELKKTNAIIERNNEELHKMNNVMVGRELKMMELKKEIEELKSKTT